MIDETQGQGPEQTTGQETSLGGASEWSTVQPLPQPPVNAARPEPPAATFPSLEPLPPSVPPGAASTAPVPPAGPPPGPAPTGYQPVYGTGPGAANASGQGGYPPPPGTPGMPPPPPPGYGAPGGGGYPPPPPGGPPAGQGLSSQAAAAISYLTFIPAVIFLIMEPYSHDRFVRFHAWQCIALTVILVVVGIIFRVLGFVGFHLVWWMFHSLIDLVIFICWLIAIIKASQGQWFRIPVAGDLAQSFAGKQ